MQQRGFMKQVTQQRLKELLRYDAATGSFFWCVNRGGRTRAGDLAGRIAVGGYVRIRVDGCEHMAHRLAWLYVYGETPSSHIDHINGNAADNRIENLRLATPFENQQNVGLKKSNRSGYVGVCWQTKESAWRARITVHGVRLSLGHFKTAEDAAAAYASAKAKHHTFQPSVRNSTIHRS